MIQQSEYKKSSLGIVGGTVFGRYRKTSIEETFNMMITDGSLVDFPGYIKRVEIKIVEESREIFRSTRFQHLIVVIGKIVYIVNDDFAVASVGNLNTSSGSVYIAENQSKQIAIVDGLNLYIYNWGTSVFSTVPSLVNPIYIESMDGYFIATTKQTNLWQLSDLNNGLVWPFDQNTVGALQTKPDNAIAVVRLDRQLFVMGRVTTELWRDVGSSPFPFQRDNTLSIDYGVISADSIASGFGMIVWLSNNEKSGLTIRYSTGSR